MAGETSQFRARTRRAVTWSARAARSVANAAALAALAVTASCYARIESGAAIQSYPPPPSAPLVVVDRYDTDPACLSTFHPVLAPHGAWVDDAELGYVWVPATTVVGVGFIPYVTSGHWSYTADGYVWVSDHPWGWATFHYGRWSHSPVHGWVWIPGSRYATSWVDWRYSATIIGWAPARPTWRFRGGVAYVYEAPPAPFVFVHSHAFLTAQPSLVLLPPEVHATLFAKTTRWTPTPARPFVGPDPTLAGIPREHVLRAAVPPPAHAQPHAVPWIESAPLPKPKPNAIPPKKPAPPLNPPLSIP